MFINLRVWIISYGSQYENKNSIIKLDHLLESCIPIFSLLHSSINWENSSAWIVYLLVHYLATMSSFESSSHQVRSMSPKIEFFMTSYVQHLSLSLPTFQSFHNWKNHMICLLYGEFYWCVSHDYGVFSARRAIILS